MYSNRLATIALVTVLLCSSIAFGATAISAHERPSVTDQFSVADRPVIPDQSAEVDRPHPADQPADADRQNVSDQSRASYPTGYAADRVDAASAIAQHHRAVTASESVHTSLSYAATANGGASVRTVEAWTNFSRDEQLLSAEGVYHAAERYVESGVTYTNTSVSYGDAPSYNRTRGTLLVNRSTGRDVLGTFLPYLDLALRNTATVDGQRLLTYEATGFDADSFGIYMRGVTEVRSVNATLVVNDRGRIHEFSFTLDAVADDGNPLTVDLSLELDGFGNTSVRKSGWVGEEFDEDRYGNKTWT